MLYFALKYHGDGMKKIILVLLLCTSALFSQWQLRDNGLPKGSNMGWAIDAIDQNNAVIGLRTGAYITNDGGNTWRQVSTEGFYDVAMVSANLIYGVSNLKIFKTTDGGTSWTAVYQFPPNNGYFNYIKVFQGTIIAQADVSTMTCPQILKSTDEGNTWQSVNQSSLTGGASGDLWRRLDFSTPDIGLFHVSLLTPQHTWRTTDGGATWTDIGLSPAIKGIKMYDQNYGIAIGNDIVAGVNTFSTLITKDGGVNWETKSTSTTTQYYIRDLEFIPNKPAEILMSTLENVFYSADSGKTWSRQNINLGTTRCEDIKFVTENSGWFLCLDGSVYWTNNKGNSVVGLDKRNKVPTQFSLEQNYPNPFNPSTKIKFSLPEAGRVTLKIYDILGRDIKTLIDNEKSAGSHVIEWNGDNSLGQKVCAGIYLYSIITDKFIQTRKMILLK